MSSPLCLYISTSPMCLGAQTPPSSTKLLHGAGCLPSYPGWRPREQRRFQIVRERPRSLLLIALAAAAYCVAAWMVAPGFFDGLAPPGPYRWTSPPPQFQQANQPPLSARHVAPVGPDGRVEPALANTQDGQASIAL